MNDPWTDGDAIFRVVTIPGHVLLIGGTRERNRYQAAKPDPKFPEFFFNDSEGRFYFKSLTNEKDMLFGNFAKVLDIKPDSKTVEVDIEIEQIPKTGR